MRELRELQFLLPRREVHRDRDRRRIDQPVLRGRWLHDRVPRARVVQHRRLRGWRLQLQEARHRLVQPLSVLALGVALATSGCAYDWTVGNADGSTSDSGTSGDGGPVGCGNCAATCTGCSAKCENATCKLGCVGATCTGVCATGQSCDVGSAGATVNLTCKTGSSCSVGCVSSTCDTTCEQGSTCTVACNTATCNVHCAAGATCTCTGSTCTCDGAGCK